jgi:hypothetical protein
MRIIRTLSILVAGASALYILANSGEQQRSQAPAHELIINVQGNTIAIDQRFLAVGSRGSYTGAITDDLVWLYIDWPSMGPFHEREALPPRIRYKPKLSVMIKPSGALDADARRRYLQTLQRGFATRHVPNSAKFGLERTSLQEGATSPFGDDDVLAHFGTTDTLIKCSPDRDPDPGTAAAQQLVAAGGLLKTPHCTQMFFVPELRNASVDVRYQRVHLKDWPAIQEKVSDFIKGALSAAAKNQKGARRNDG